MRRATVAVASIGLALSLAPARAEEHPPASTPAPEVGPSRLFFSPTARTLPRGTGTVALTELIFPWVEFAVWDRVSVQSVALLPIPELWGPGGLIVGPKIQVLRTKGVDGAVGLYQALAPGGRPGGLAYGVVTAGNASASLTAGYGIGYGEFWDTDGSPRVVFLGADVRISRSVRLMAEGFLGADDLDVSGATLTGAVRITKKRFWVDVGFVLPIYETGSGTPFPLLTAGFTF
jgi:hypothetical protein